MPLGTSFPSMRPLFLKMPPPPSENQHMNFWGHWRPKPLAVLSGFPQRISQQQLTFTGRNSSGSFEVILVLILGMLNYMHEKMQIWVNRNLLFEGWGGGSVVRTPYHKHGGLCSDLQNQHKNWADSQAVVVPPSILALGRRRQEGLWPAWFSKWVPGKARLRRETMCVCGGGHVTIAKTDHDCTRL